MINLKIFIFSILLPASLNYSVAQEIFTPRPINTTKEYIHSTGLKFPVAIKEFSRRDIASFDSSESNIGITYISQSPNGRTQFTVYVYPENNANENRLRYEYLKALKSIECFTKRNDKPNQHLYPFVRNGYKINGIKAEINDFVQSEYNYLAVFECGKWMMKFRMTSNFQETKVLNEIQRDLLQLFNPTELVKKYPLNPKAQIVFFDNSLQDTVLLRSIMFAGAVKIGWVETNLDSLERCAGFPGLYLEEHTAALKLMVRVWKKSKESRKPSTDSCMRILRLIINSGYLNEFVMDQYNMLLFTPPGISFHFENYKKWKVNLPIPINCNQPFYMIAYKD